MQVFIVGTPLETAVALDNRRLNKQIIEVEQILDAMRGKTAWSNHPCVLQYKGHEKWLEHYLSCLTLYKHNARIHAKVCSDLAQICKPKWHTQEYFDQMKRRLYQKNEKHYQQWSHLCKSLDNWYYIDGKFVKYRNGKKIKE